MLRVGKKSEYALTALVHLGTLNGTPLRSAAKMAKRYNLSFTLLSKVLQKLKNEGLIESVQGMKGGYSLKRDLDSISIKEIFTLFEANDSLTNCTSSKRNGCPHEKTCPARHPLTQLDSRIQNILNSLTLADLMQERRNSHGMELLEQS